MKLRFALAGLVALSGAALSVEATSAMPLTPFGQFQNSNVEKAAVACGPRGCVRTAPVYRYGGVHRYGYGVRRSYAYRRY
jgi:hypothetical protein